MTSVHARRSFLNHESIAVARKPARHAQAVARLSLFINGKAYHVRPLPVDASTHLKAFRLRKFDGTEYDVAQGGHGITCDCPDFTFNRDGIDPEGCKHIKALVACGLMDRSQDDDRPAAPVADVSAAREHSTKHAIGPVSACGEPTTSQLPPAPSLAPLNGQPMTLLEIVEHEALGYKTWGSPAGKFLSDQLGRIAQLLRWTGARTPEEHEERMEVYDRELRDRYYDQGYHDGLEAGRREACPCGRRHD
jgi:hypothetical protein